MRNKIILVIFLTTTSMFLIGCEEFTPQTVGISDQEWSKYTQQEQAKIQQNYQYILDTASKDVKTSGGKSCLNIKINSGKVTTPPFIESYSYQPVTLKILENTCQAITFNTNSDAGKITTYACFNNNTLFLDPSRYEIDKRFGTIQIHYSSLWETGFTYQGLTTTGFAKLQNINLYIKKIPLTACQIMSSEAH